MQIEGPTNRADALWVPMTFAQRSLKFRRVVWVHLKLHIA